MTTQRALSGIQKDVLSLYRRLLRASRQCEDASTRQAVRGFSRYEFDRYRDVKTTDVQLIEHLVRKGHKQLAVLQEPGFVRFSWEPPSQGAGKQQDSSA